MLLFILVAQVTASSSMPDFDLGKLAPEKPGCASTSATSGGEIVVCAKRRATNDIPIKAMPVEPMLPKAEFKLFGKVRGKVVGEQTSVGGFVSSRAMVTMSVPF